MRIADLDPQQPTVVLWENARREDAVRPSLDVKGYNDVEEALEAADDIQLLILDAPGRSGPFDADHRQARPSYRAADGPSRDDLYPGVLLFHELVRAGIPPGRLLFALCRTQTKEEESAARQYVAAAGYQALAGALPERAGYRDAQNRGRAITETTQKDLNARADALMLELMGRVKEQISVLREESGKSKRERSRK